MLPKVQAFFSKGAYHADSQKKLFLQHMLQIGIE